MNSVAFICPLHDMKNHFDFAIDLVKSILEFEVKADLIFIFSDEREQGKFMKKLSQSCPKADVKSQVIPHKLDIYSAKAITKKLYGLKRYMREYEYIILTDCEAKIVRNFDAKDLAEKVWRTKSMLASNISPDGFVYMRSCYKTMGIYYNHKLRKSLGGYRYNFWFNDLQVYKCSLLPEFFEWLQKFDIGKILNNNLCFEYYIFYAFLCLKHNYPIIKYHYFSMGGINEYLDLFSVKKQHRILERTGVHWTSSKDVIDLPQIVMLFHLDRNRNIGGYGYEKYRFDRLVEIILRRYLILIKEIPEYLLNLLRNNNT